MLKEINLDKWKQWLNIAKVKQGEKVAKRVKLYREYYRGQQWAESSLASHGGGYHDDIVENMVYLVVSVIAPSINLHEPKINIFPKKKPFRVKGQLFNTIAAAEVVEMLMNTLFKNLKVKSQVDKCVVDALLGFWGLIEIGYSFKSDIVAPGGKNQLLEINELIKQDSPFAIRRSELDLLVDPKATDHNFRDADWIALKWRRTLEDIKENPRFKGNVGGLKPNFHLQIHKGKEILVPDDSLDLKDLTSLDMVAGWRIWDRKRHIFHDIVENHDKELDKNKWPFDFGDGFPVESLYFNENPDELLPVSLTDIYRSMQDALNFIGSLELDHVRRLSKRLYLAKEGSFTEDEELKIQYGADGTIIYTTVNPEGALINLPDAPMSHDIGIVKDKIKNSIKEMAGIAAFEGEARNFRTAQEPALIAQSVQTRRAKMGASVEDFLSRIVSKLTVVTQQTIGNVDIKLDKTQFEQAVKTTPELLSRETVDLDQTGKFGKVPHLVQKIVGTEKALVMLPWLSIDKDTIKGEYEFEIEAGSTQSATEEKKKGEALLLYDKLQQNPLIDPREGTKRLLDTFDVRNIDLLLKPDERLEQEKQQALEQSVAAENAKGELKSKTDLQKTQMKSQIALKKMESDERIAAQTTKGNLLSVMLKGKSGSGNGGK